MEYIARNVHKRYTWARVENVHGDRVAEQRVLHQRGAIQRFVQQWTAGSPVAVETVGNWYWVVDEIEAGGGQPQLVNARLAKLLNGSVNKSDQLDAKGLNRLQRTGTLPTVWIPSGAVRDARELPRTRMLFSRQRTQVKNRVLATIAKHGSSSWLKDSSRRINTGKVSPFGRALRIPFPKLRNLHLNFLSCNRHVEEDYHACSINDQYQCGIDRCGRTGFFPSPNVYLSS